MINVERKIELQGMPFDKAEMTPDNVKELDEFMADLKPVTLGAIIVTGQSETVAAAQLLTMARARYPRTSTGLMSLGVPMRVSPLSACA